MRGARLAALLVASALAAGRAVAQVAPPPPTPAAAAPVDAPSRVGTIARFLGGGALGLVAHESGHLTFDVVFDAHPRFKKVDFAGIPFFALTHDSGLPYRQELTISSAGFWVQHAGSEWILTRHPRLRWERKPMTKGVLAFNVVTSVVYAGAAFARTGPVERDTRGIAASLRIGEPWVGALLLAPATLDTYRYLHPEARWAKWASRSAKVAMLLLVFR